jgi:hypothetical protein
VPPYTSDLSSFTHPTQPAGRHTLVAGLGAPEGFMMAKVGSTLLLLRDRSGHEAHSPSRRRLE